LMMAEKQTASNELRQQVLDWGASLVGFADLRGVAPPEFSTWSNAVSIALRLDPAVMATVREGPTPEYYEEYKRVNRALNELAGKTAALIASLGYRAEPYPATIVDRSQREEFDRTLSVAFQHKTAATRAGLGWIGTSALLVTPQFGPRVRLATVFTDMPLDVGTPVTASHCGDCKACLVACPARAIKGREWRVGVAREELVDAWACRAKAKQLMLARVGLEDSVCGACLAVCPVAKE
jgi:epoxyqueuosine reductase